MLTSYPALISHSVQAQTIQDSLNVVSSTNREAGHSQLKIDKLSRETRLLLEEYRNLQDSNEYQQAYTRELEHTNTTQLARIELLQQQIAQARITRQRILPLMRSMADALETFVVLDLPFHQEQRVSAILQLKQRLDNPELSVVARFRLLLEAYQLEQNYSASIEAWRDSLQLQGETVSVEYLRLGRAALYYQTLDGEHSGYWQQKNQSWLTLDKSHNRRLAQALRIARNQTAPQLLELPLLMTEVVSEARQ
ncbi:MAG: DUF3450 domain-containing protein [Parahaliea sp.]